MKKIEVQILMGLPGSGKTHYANSQIQNDNKEVHILDFDNYIPLRPWIKYGVDIIIVDGLFLTNEAVINIIDKINQESKNIYSFNFTIIYWKENRAMCKYNDEGRRTKNSLITIEKSIFEQPDVSLIKEKTGQNVNLIFKDVVKKPDYVKILQKKNCNIKGDELISEKWIIKGESWTYTGKRYPVSVEEPKEFEELYNFLEEFYPELTALQLRYIQKNLIEYKTIDDNDYYSSVTYGYYTISMEKLIDYISKN